MLAAIRNGAALAGQTDRKNILRVNPLNRSLPGESPVPLPSVTQRTTQLIAAQDVSEAHEQGPRTESPRGVQE